MGFCINCGGQLDENHRFCSSCGSPVEPPKESDSPTSTESILESDFEKFDGVPKLNPEQQAKMLYDSSTIDRKTLFDDGMMVLSSKDLILYTSDEKDELKRIPIHSIKSCGFSSIRRCLMIKRRINGEENFQIMLARKHADLENLKHEKVHYEDLLRQTRIREKRRQITNKISKTDHSLRRLIFEIQQLESDPDKIRLAHEKVSDIQKEFFKLPKSFDLTSDKTVKEEYRMWEYVVNRRMEGIPKIRIETLPYDAIVTINGRVFGTTPLTIDKPLIDEAILDGKYIIKVLKEGYDHVKFNITADLGKDSFIKKMELSPRGKIEHQFDKQAMRSPVSFSTAPITEKTDHQFDKQIRQLRDNVPDRSVDMSFYKVEREVEGKNEILLLTSDEIMGMTKDRETCLFEIPYGAINNAKYDKGFLRGNKAVKITYNEKDFKNLEFNFWLDEDDKISQSELRQRSEKLVEIINKKRKESKVYDIPNRIRSPDYFIVTEKDIDNNFKRFEPFEFERLVAKLFERKGYKTTVTQERADFGVDVLAEAGNDRIAIQVKHWQASVGGPDVHKTIGSMMTAGANRAIVVTSSDFTNQAYEIQRRGSPVELWNGSRLQDEFRQHLLDSIKEARKNEIRGKRFR